MGFGSLGALFLFQPQNAVVHGVVSVCRVFPLEQSEISEHDNEVVARQLLLLGKRFVAELVDVDGDMGIACQINHDV